MVEDSNQKCHSVNCHIVKVVKTSFPKGGPMIERGRTHDQIYAKTVKATFCSF